MGQPRTYARQYNFTDFQTTSPSTPIPANQVDLELNTAKLTLDDLNANIALIQRDDGKLLNASVHKDAFDAGALALLNADGFTPKGNWSAGATYAVNDLVDFNNATYLATAAHTSSSAFSTDLSTKWILLANAAISGTANSVDKFEGTGSQTAFTLTSSYASNTAVLVFVNGALRNPGDDYSISGTTLTFVTAPSVPSVSGNENVIAWGPSVVAQAAGDVALASSGNASGFADEAQSWASKINGIVESTDYSSKAYAIGGTGVDAGSGSAKDWAIKTSSTVGNTSEYSAKYWATSTPVTNVSTNIAAVTNVSGISSAITTVSGISANVTTAAGISADITTVAGKASLLTSDFVSDLNTITADVISDLNTLATSSIVSDLNVLSASGVITNISTLSAASVVEDMGLLGTAAVVEDMALLATSANIANMATVGTSANVTAITNVSGSIANVNTVSGANANITAIASDLGGSNTIGSVAGAITNVNNVGGSISNVNTVASNLASVNTFGSTYKISQNAPTTNLIDGMLWWDSTNDVMKVYNASSSSFVLAGSSVNGTSNRYDYVVGTNSGAYTTASTSVFPATYDAGFVDVFLNGAKLIPSTDFTATNGTTVTLSAAATAGDNIAIVGFGTFSVATDLAKTGGTMTGDIVFASTQTFDGVDVSALNTTVSGKANLSGATFTGDIDAGANKILYANMYSAQGDLPNASTYHGMFAHVHGTAKAVYAHGGNWLNLVAEDSSGTVKFDHAIEETTYTLSGTELNPASGTIQTKALSGTVGFTDALTSGESMVLQVTGGASATGVSFPTMTWVTSAGNAAPTLTAADTIVFWKVGTTLYGAYAGSSA